MKRLEGKRVGIEEITEELCRDFFDIYQLYFENVTYEVFKDHVGHKDEVIILSDRETKKVCGFSTLKVLTDTIEGKTVWGIFSGDTIIHKDYWGEQELVRHFCQFCGQVAAIKKEDEKLYWLLISKGYKTYRYLPVFTSNYYPNYREDWPEWERKVMEKLYSRLYPEEFDTKTGLLTFKNKIGNLRKGVGEADEVRLENPDIAFFTKTNPDHMSGVELACLTELSKENMKSVARLFFERGYKAAHRTQVNRVERDSAISLQ